MSSNFWARCLQSTSAGAMFPVHIVKGCAKGVLVLFAVLFLAGCGEPTVTVDATPATVESATVTITGTVTPVKDTTISSVIARTAAGDINVPLSGTRFSVQVPLALGANTISVIATATASGQTRSTTVSVSVKRISLPKFSTIAPAEGVALTTADTVISGEILTVWPLSGVQFFLNGSVKTLSEASPGIYRFNEPVTLVAGANAIQLRATTADGVDNRVLNLTYNAPKDTAPPLLSIDNPQDQSLEAATVSITGAVSDPEQVGSGISAISVVSNRTGATQYSPTLAGNAYSVVVPLSLGQNIVSVLARDRSGNETSAQLTVTRISPPRFVNVSPADGTLFNDQPIANVSGEFTTEWPLSEIHFFFGDDESPLSLIQPGRYAFAVNNVALKVGTNIFPMRITTPDGAATRNVSLVYRDERDITAPVITLDIEDNSKIDAAQVNLTGQVVDPAQAGSGVANITLTSNRTGSTQHPIQRNGDTIQAVVPLTLGENTLTVSATDLRGNASTLSVTIVRISPPKIESVQPANGTSVTTATTRISGQVKSDWPLAQVEFFFNGSPSGLTQQSPGVYGFDMSSVALSVGQNTFQLRATTPDGEYATPITIIRTVDPDTTPPTLTVETQDNQSIEAATIRITGTVQDPAQYGSGVASVIVAVGGKETNGAMNADHFEADIPIDLGENLITITATDLEGNSTTLTRHVKRISLPRIGALQPLDGSVFNVPSTAIAGEVTTDWPVTSLVVRVNGNQADVSALNAGGYRFSLADAGLTQGENGFDISAQTPDGTDTKRLNVVFQPDPDTVPPTLVVLGATELVTENASIEFMGTVTDSENYFAGVDAVDAVSDRFASASFAAIVSEDKFRVEVPLAVGENRIVIVATDTTGNRAEVTRQVRRLSRPQLFNVTPANGTLVKNENLTLSGEIRTLQPIDAVRVAINEWVVTPTATNIEGVYHFESPGIELSIGENEFQVVVQTPDGNAIENLSITHRPQDEATIPAPVLSIVAPQPNQIINEQTFRVKARVVSEGGAAHVKINGVAYPAGGANQSDYYVDTLVSFTEDEDTTEVNFEATDSLGKTSTLSARYYRDRVMPVITLNNALVASTAINPVIESELTLAGVVTDANLASLTLNDQPVRVRTGDQPGLYFFGVVVRVPVGGESTVQFVARDIAGNQSAVEYILKSEAETGLVVLLPEEGAEFLADNAGVPVQVAARMAGLAEGATVKVRTNADTAVDLAVSGTLASGTITLPAQPGIYSLVYEVFNANGHLVATTARAVKVSTLAQVDLALSRQEPENGAVHVEPNQPIEIYFNKTIDPARLAIHVTETLHGATYVNIDPLGADFLTAKGYQLQEVHRDGEPVPGTLSVLPEKQGVAFYPARYFGFGSTINVDVTYDSKELSRFTFNVRKLPTFVVGGVVDQFGQPLKGVTISLPGLQRTTVTNNDGAFAFGFQEPAGKEIPGGRYQLLVNPGFAAPGYGTQSITINLQESRRNNLSLVRLQELHPEIPFQLIGSGQARVSLANNELNLDLTEARLLFPDGRTSGDVQMQFFPYEHFDVATLPGALPHWAYASQPRGIRVEGRISVTLKMPPLNGGYDYLLPETEYVAMVAYDSDEGVMKPVGVGQVHDYTVSSVGKIEISSLDYLGYALIDPRHQELLRDIAAGRKSLRELLSVLQ